MAFFNRFRTSIRKLEHEKDYPGLIRSLCSEEPAVRTDAAKSLCALGAPALPDLLSALESARPVARNLMAEMLASAGTASIPLLLALTLRASPDLQTSIAGAIAKADDEDMFEALLPALHHERPAIRKAAAASIVGMGRKAIPHLQKALHDSSPSVRKEAAATLARLGWTPDDTGGKITFYYILNDWDELAKFQSAAVPILVRALSNKDVKIRCESARTLGKIRDGRAVPALIKTAGDPQVDVRVRVVEALGAIGDDRAKPPLIEALNDPHHQVRMEAAWALDRLSWIPHSDLARAEYLIAREQWSELVQMGRVAIMPLIRALCVEYSGVRTGASEALRQLGEPALDALNAAAQSKNIELREQAEITLEYIRARNEENTRTKPKLEDSSNYDRELEEGLAAQKKIETQFGAPARPQSSTHRRPRPTEEVEAEEIEIRAEEEPETEVQPTPDPGELDRLLKESQKAEKLWAGVKSQIKQKEKVTLDEIIPVDDDDTEEVEIVIPEKPDRPVVRSVIVEPDTPEEHSDVQERAPDRVSLERYLKALKSSDETIRAAAIAALRSMGEAAIAYLIQALTDPHAGVRIAAAEALGELGDAGGVDALIIVARDTDQDVRTAAATALGRIKDARAADPLMQMFRDNYPNVRSAAARAIAALGADMLEPLEEALKNPVPAVRLTAATALGLIGDLRSIPLLVMCLEDPAREVGATAARVLGRIGDPAIDALSFLLREGSRDGRLAAIDALAEIGSDQANEALRSALRDEDRDVRERAAAVLKRRHVVSTAGDQEDIDTLIAALKDSSQEVQLSASTRLIALGRPAAERLILALKREDPAIQVAAAGILSEMQDSAVEPLMEALSDADRIVRLVAARNLGNIGDRRAIGPLIAALQREPDSKVRAAVAEALGYMGSEQVIEPLALALQDRDESVKIAAARSLGYIEDSRAIEPLIRALSDVDDRVRYAALEALKDPGGAVQGHLVGALRTGDKEFRAGVAEALGEAGWEPRTREELALYLMALDRWAEVERVGADALPVLTNALSDPSIEMRANAVKAIARIGGEEAIAPLIGALGDGAIVVRRRAERALVEIGDAAVPSLTDAAEKAPPEVREGLQRIMNEIRR